jgi:hypothetical protein
VAGNITGSSVRGRILSLRHLPADVIACQRDRLLYQHDRYRCETNHIECTPDHQLALDAGTFRSCPENSSGKWSNLHFLNPYYRIHDLCLLLWHADAPQDPEAGIAQRCEPSEDLPCHFIGSSPFQPDGACIRLSERSLGLHAT